MINVLKPLIKQFMPFAMDRMGFNKPPRLFLKNDTKNASNPLGKTAFYDPASKSVTIYTTNRHPKDIMRSLSHELVHHTQNCRGDFDNVNEMGEGYAQNDEHLREMEREAYEVGNMCFRDWEDSTKGTIYYEHLQKGANNTMSTKDWKNGELTTILSEAFGFKFDLNGLNEKTEEVNEQENELEENSDNVFAPNHYCVHHGGVSHNGSVQMAEAVGHNWNEELNKVTHYDMQLEDGTVLKNVAFEDIQVTNATLAEGHSHPAKRDEDDEAEDEMNEAEVSEEVVEEEDEIEERRARGRKTAASAQGRHDDPRARVTEDRLREIIKQVLKERE